MILITAPRHLIVDGQEAAVVAPGTSASVTVAPGHHTVQVVAFGDDQIGRNDWMWGSPKTVLALEIAPLAPATVHLPFDDCEAVVIPPATSVRTWVVLLGLAIAVVPIFLLGLIPGFRSRVLGRWPALAGAVPERAQLRIRVDCPSA